MDGVLLAYWEQGWEGRIEFGFQPDGGGQWLTLEPGDQLTILGEDGSRLWSGIIGWTKPGFLERRRYPGTVWSWVKQRGVPYGEWIGFFWHKPALRAKLVRSGA